MASIRQAWLKRGGDGQYVVQWSMRPWPAHVTQGMGAFLPPPLRAAQGRGQSYAALWIAPRSTRL